MAENGLLWIDEGRKAAFAAINKTPSGFPDAGSRTGLFICFVQPFTSSKMASVTVRSM